MRTHPRIYQALCIAALTSVILITSVMHTAMPYGTEYVSFAHALRPRRRQRQRRRRRRRRRRRGGIIYVRIGETHVCIYSRFQRIHINELTRGFTCVRKRKRAPASVLPPHPCTGAPDSSFACALGCTRICVRAHEHEPVTTRCAP